MIHFVTARHRDEDISVLFVRCEVIDPFGIRPCHLRTVRYDHSGHRFAVAGDGAFDIHARFVRNVRKQIEGRASEQQVLAVARHIDFVFAAGQTVGNDENDLRRGDEHGRSGIFRRTCEDGAQYHDVAGFESSAGDGDFAADRCVDLIEQHDIRDIEDAELFGILLRAAGALGH